MVSLRNLLSFCRVSDGESDTLLGVPQDHAASTFFTAGRSAMRVWWS
ncbi:MAG: hypothetical protein JWN13_7079 [Betaproteobacteria bacterium]|jgi:hypothetical protein|nr:hypothetical protein [Betaproteobacteria bacterium]